MILQTPLELFDQVHSIGQVHKILELYTYACLEGSGDSVNQSGLPRPIPWNQNSDVH